VTAYYNEWEPYAARWLRNLIAAGHIAPGEVDERSITEVQPDDLVGFSQCHFFAGIGGWSHALRLAGWPDDRPVWSGSCPCQPFSTAGKGKGVEDERHLWPEFRRLISECSPAIVFGEQVASAAGRDWLAAVRADLEALEYAVGSADLCAAGVGAPHIRQRLWFVADADDTKSQGRVIGRDSAGERAAGAGSVDGQLVYFQSKGGCWRRPHGNEEPRGSGPFNFWSDAEYFFCRDGKARPTQPGLFPLAHGVSGRVGRLRAYGNAIVPEVAAEVIAAFMECRP
jgi:DNA (cytosine-5)-methyltransferase 1